MEQENYDEYQIKNRHRAGYQTFFIISVLILINGFITEEYMWATPLGQACVIIIIACMYFDTYTILKGSQMSLKEKRPIFNVLFNIGMGLIWGFLTYMSIMNQDSGKIFSDGQINLSAIPMLYGVTFIYKGIITFIKLMYDKKKYQK